jgi:hypothetical protein
MDMRGGFQKMAKSVAGSEKTEKKSSTLSNLVWLLVLFALLAWMFYRRS